MKITNIIALFICFMLISFTFQLSSKSKKLVKNLKKQESLSNPTQNDLGDKNAEEKPNETKSNDTTEALNDEKNTLPVIEGALKSKNSFEVSNTLKR